MRRLVIIAALALAASCAKKPAPPLPVRVVTTFDIAATGIVAHLASVFGAQSGRRVEVRALDPTAIVTEARRAMTDVVIIDDARIVAALRNAHLVRLSAVVANDDFLIVGPPGNPAHVRKADTADEAFRRVFERRRAFCSVTDVASLHQRELEIWSAAAIHPEKNRRYRACKGDAATALKEAARTGAYTLTDRATFDAVRPDRVVTFKREGTMLHDDLTAVLIDQPHRRKDADWFAEWLMSYRGRDAIESYRLNGEKRWYLER